MDINCTTEEIPNIIDDKEIEVIIMAFIETLKRQKSKCDKDEVFKLVKDKIEENLEKFSRNFRLFNQKWFCKMQPHFKQNMYLS